MSPEEICDILKDEFGTAVVDTVLAARRPYAVIDVERWVEVATFLRDDPRMQFNMFQCLSAIDLLEDNRLAAVYDLFSVPTAASFSVPTAASGREFPRLRHHFAVRVTTDRDDPHIPTVSHLWPAAEWHEREAYDLMGIIFDGHADLTRILCADDWVGHPLRKDYEFPVEYHGIPATTEYGLSNPRH